MNSDGQPRLGEQTLSRRRFLTSGLGVGAALVAGGGVSSLRQLGARGTAPSAVGPHLGERPRRGGTLRAALSGGDSLDTLDPLNPVNNIDFARVAQLFDPLVVVGRNGTPELQLASEISPNRNATVWTIRLRPGVTFHNGRDLTAADVVHTFRQILNPKHPAAGALQLAPIDLKAVRAIDRLTVRVPCLTPFATLVEVLAEPPGTSVIPVGFDLKRPVGTGPFKYHSFTPGSQSRFVRNDSYWREGLPYLDGVVISDYAEETSQVNALIAGQVDAVDLLSADSIAAVKSGGAEILISNGGAWTPFTMRVDQRPFNDVRVRQAMRLVVNRPQMRELVFEGHGLIGNDVFAIVDPAYDHRLPQRHQDLDRAKHLLRKAGHENLTVELVTAPIAAGAVNMAQVFAQQAAGAGVTVKLRQTTVTDFYGPSYLKWQFAQDFYYYNPYLPQVAISTLRKSSYNECHFNNARYTALYNEALRTVNRTRRYELEHEMQTIDYDEGGYIIPLFSASIDGFSKKLHGVEPSKTGISLNTFNFKRVWLS